MDIETIVRNATAKTIIRDRLEDLWEERGRLLKKDFKEVSDGLAYGMKKVVRPYFDAIVEESRYVRRLLRSQTPEQIFADLYKQENEGDIEIRSMPYGIHFYLCCRDMQKTFPTDRYKDATGFLGHALGFKYRNVSLSVGQKTARDFHEFFELLMEAFKISQEFQDNFLIDYDLKFEDFLEILKYSSPEQLMTHEKASKVMFDAQQNYIRCQNAVEDTTFHELEHSHSDIILFPNDLNPQGEKMALAEIIAYSNSFSLALPDTIGEEKREEMFISKMTMKSAFDDFFNMLIKITNESPKLDTYKKRRIFPMTLLEIGDFDLIKNKLDLIIAKVQSLEGEL